MLCSYTPFSGEKYLVLLCNTIINIAKINKKLIITKIIDKKI